MVMMRYGHLVHTRLAGWRAGCLAEDPFSSCTSRKIALVKAYKISFTKLPLEQEL
jgi:hypothetical protein